MSEQARLSTALQSRYSIERELGAGGMATVYLAEDLKHKRRVAIKVLRPELAAVVGAQRFLAEIRTTASLQHPGILPLHDSGEADSFLYYVMPYVEGESLRARLERDHQLPVEEAVRIAGDVAEALEYAHGRGVIHRDVKPANILLAAGRPVLSDFGIALAVGAAGGGRLTETGLSLGTPHYMSPEQATGEQHVGPGTDVYALGSVLYEMLVGDPPYTGSTAQAVLGQIIAGEAVSARRKRPSVPAHVDAVVRRALEKLPADRFRSAGELARALADPGFRHGQVAEARAGGARTGGGGGLTGGDVRRWKRLAVACGGVAGLMSLAFVLALLRPSRPASRVAWQTTIELPDTAPLGLGFDLSRDGSVLVWSSWDAGRGHGHLWMRRAGAPSPVAIPGTESAVYPRISPDGRRVVFYNVEGPSVEVVPLEGGTPIRVSRGNTPAVWTDDGHVAFGASDGNIVQAAPGGGADTLLVPGRWAGWSIDPVQDALPDHGGLIILESSHALAPDSGRIAVVGPGGGAPIVLTPGVAARYARGGRLIVTRADGTIVAFPFTRKSRRITGPLTPLVTGTRPGVISSGGRVAVSADGHLVYATSGGFGLKAELMRVTRSGDATPLDSGWVQNFNGVTVSPDGDRIAASIVSAALSGYGQASGTEEGIAILDPASGSVARVLVPTGGALDPVFTPDGRSVIFAGPGGLYRASVGRGTPEMIRKPSEQARSAATPAAGDSAAATIHAASPAPSPDGRRLYFEVDSGADSSEVRVVSMDSLDAPGRVVVADAGGPVVSPDGRWLAYFSYTTGTWQVRVRSTDPLRDEEWHVAPSAEPYTVLRWSRDGRELYYMNGDSLYAARVEGGATFRVVSTHALFASRRYWRGFDVTPDGAFVMIGDVSRATTELYMIDDLAAAVAR